MGKVEAMDILQPMGNIHQLRRSVVSVFANSDVVTHKLSPIYFPVFLDELIDGTVVHPFRQQREPRCLHVQRCAEQW